MDRNSSGELYITGVDSSGTSRSSTVQKYVDNEPPVIEGTPATEIYADKVYSFTPAVFDADGDILTFTVENLPSWGFL